MSWNRCRQKQHKRKDVRIASVPWLSVRLLEGVSIPTPANRLHESIGRVFPGLSSLVKPRSCLPCIDSSQVALHQDEGLLDELMQLVDRGQRIDTDDGKELFEARGKIGRGHLHLVHQAIQPPPARIVEAAWS